MSDLTRLKIALVNADAAGDADAASAFAREIRRMEAAPSISDPTDGMSGVEKFAAGAGKAITDTGRGLAQGLQWLVSAPKGAELVSQESVDEAKRLDAPLMNTGAGLAGNVAGNLAMTLGPAAGLSAAGRLADAPRAIAAARGIMAPQTIAGGAAGGALLGAAQPVASDDSRGVNTALGGLVGGAGTAVVNGLVRLLGPRAALLTPEQQSLVQRAIDMGYDLKPSEITGKRWQQNLEAAMGQHPVTSGRMQAIGQSNRAVSDRIVNDALQSAGGAIDQPSAAAGAMEGWQQGMAGEKGRLGAAYRSLLDGTDVNLEAARPALEELRQGQQQLPKSSQSGPAMDALQELLGSKDYAKKARPKPSLRVDQNKDDIITAIRKIGGIDPTQPEVTAVARENPFNGDPRFGPVWTKPNGRMGGVTHGLSPDNMAQSLYERGYLSERSIDEMTDKIADASFQKPHYSIDYVPPSNDPLTSAIEGLTEKLGAKAKRQNGPGQVAGYIRGKSPVPGDVAQALRSDYTDMSATQSLSGRDQRLFGSMKSAIDGAIEQSLPEAAQGNFAAINRRYGIYAGLNSMSPKQQNVFLNQLYRGSNSPDQFYTFLGLAPDGPFKDVARGFLSDLRDSATDPATKMVDAAKLGREVNKLNPEAMRVLGGDAGKTFRDVGDVGRDVLREQVGNSGSAQRLIYNGLLSGSGVGIGGYLGSEQGGSPGAAIGGAMGLFAMPKAVQAAYLSKTLGPLLTAGVKGRSGLLDEELLAILPYLGRAGSTGLLGYSSK